MLECLLTKPSERKVLWECSVCVCVWVHLKGSPAAINFLSMCDKWVLFKAALEIGCGGRKATRGRWFGACSEYNACAYVHVTAHTCRGRFPIPSPSLLHLVLLLALHANKIDLFHWHP